MALSNLPHTIFITIITTISNFRGKRDRRTDGRTDSKSIVPTGVNNNGKLITLMLHYVFVLSAQKHEVSWTLKGVACKSSVQTHN